MAEEITEKTKEAKTNITEKIKDIITKLSLTDVADAAIYSGLAYLGYEKLPDNIPSSIRLLWGPIGLKLATSVGSEGGLKFTVLGFGVDLPANSQIAGLAMLAGLGFACLPWSSTFRDNVQATNDLEVRYQAILVNPNYAVAFTNISGIRERFEAWHREFVSFGVAVVGYSTYTKTKEQLLSELNVLEFELQNYNVGGAR